MRTEDNPHRKSRLVLIPGDGVYHALKGYCVAKFPKPLPDVKPEGFNEDDFHCTLKVDGQPFVVFQFNGTWHGCTYDQWSYEQIPDTMFQMTWDELLHLCTGFFTEDMSSELFGGCVYHLELYAPPCKQVDSPASAVATLVRVTNRELTWQLGMEKMFSMVDELKLPFEKLPNFPLPDLSVESVLRITRSLAEGCSEGVVFRDNNGKEFQIILPNYKVLRRALDRFKAGDFEWAMFEDITTYLMVFPEYSVQLFQQAFTA